MKKMAFLALALGMVLSMQAGAASIGVPWFVDTAAPGSTLPPASPNLTTIIFVNNSGNTDAVCSIAYYNQDGVPLGPITNNTFVIPALATVAFRPVADDENTTANPLGQESAVGAAVPNRPTNVDPKGNGSCRITYDDQGGTVRVTGKSETWGFRSVAAGIASLNSAYLLPEGN